MASRGNRRIERRALDDPEGEKRCRAEGPAFACASAG